MNALPVAFHVWAKNCVLVPCRHFVLFGEFKSTILRKDSKLVTGHPRDIAGRHTRAPHSIPLALTASMTASTFFSLDLAFALRVTDNFQGVFLWVERLSTKAVEA